MQIEATKTDPITLELIHEGLIAICREMRANMMRTGYSSIIYEGQDFSCVMVDATGQLVAKASADHPLHIFPIPWSVQATLERFGSDVNPGDVFLHNDPYTGGTHLNDIATINPVFVDGELLAFTVVRVHWGDVGGMTPGSISGQTTEIYQEGVRIPAIRIYDGGKPNQAAIDIIFANCRGQRERWGDFQASLISCQQAARKLEAMAQKYGLGAIKACLPEFLARAEAQMRERIAAVPDGTYSYEAYVESTGRSLEPLRARIELTVKGDEIYADCTGSSAQSPGPTNIGPSMAPSGVFIIAKCYLDPESEAVNHGAWRPLTVNAPEGTFLNARLPAPCGGMAEARYGLDTAMMGALAMATPESATGDNKGCANHLYIGGRHPDGRHFLFYEYPAGGTGATNGVDGNNSVRNFQEGDFTTIQPVEAVENEHPLLVESCILRRDSAGAGKWRGGFGLRRDVRLLTDDAVLSVLTDRNILGPHGVFNAHAGAANRFTVRRDGVEIEPSPIPGKVSNFPLRHGDVVVMRSAGGGGYGDPTERDPELVLSDVRRGYISVDRARDYYGVVIGANGVDSAATATQREAVRSARTLATLAATEAPEYEGSRRVLPLSRSFAERAGIAENDVVELVNRRGAPLRAWARLVDDTTDTAHVGPVGLRMLASRPGDRLWIRRLNCWAPPPVGDED
ncbi:MAG: hydantoinase B/oxoprolinase family protein [Chloroflexi bacterium]|nr:hydantoinase B/oxoprolinase family protein [Chloroflexota bacterium]